LKLKLSSYCNAFFNFILVYVLQIDEFTFGGDFVTMVGRENLEQLHGFLTSISELMSPGLV